MTMWDDGFCNSPWDGEDERPNAQHEQSKRKRDQIEHDLYRTTASHNALVGSLEELSRGRNLSILWLSISLPLACLFLAGNLTLGEWSSAILFALFASCSAIAYGAFHRYSKGLFVIKGHKRLITAEARNLAMEYDFHALIKTVITGIHHFRGASYYLVNKGEVLGVLSIETERGDDQAKVDFLPINQAIEGIVKGRRNTHGMQLEDLLEKLESPMYQQIRFNVPYKDVILRSAIPLNKYVAELTEITNPDLIQLWMRSHFPSNIVAKRIEDIDVEALIHWCVEKKSIYIPTGFHVQLALAYLDQTNEKYAHAFVRWLRVFANMNDFRCTVPEPGKQYTGDLLIWCLKDVHGYKDMPLLVPDYFQKIVRMVVARLGVTYPEGRELVNIVKSYRQLFGTDAALKKFPGSSRILLVEDMGI